MDVTVALINYQTPDLTLNAIESFKSKYSDLPVVLLDNGSKDDGKSIELIKNISNRLSNIKAVFLKENIYHGPAMDLIIKKYVTSKYIFFLDSDTVTNREGFLEKMVLLAESDREVYGVGEITHVNKRGFKSKSGTPILLTSYMLLKTDIYHQLNPFIHHGQPTINNFFDALEKGFELKEFFISEYIEHLWRGTASRYGYGLGLRSKLDYILNRLGF